MWINLKSTVYDMNKVIFISFNLYVSIHILFVQIVTNEMVE